MQVAEGNVGLAFALVIGAGLCTTIGSTLVFCSSLANARLLAGSLGVSAGVMLYVSFSEIFMSKAVAAFAEHYQGQPGAEGQALRAATYCFFGGIALIACLNSIVHWLEHCSAGKHSKQALSPPRSTAETIATDLEQATDEDGSSVSNAGSSKAAISSEVGALEPPQESPIAVPDNVREIMESDDHHKGLHKMGVMTCVAIAIHNFPEGLATFVAALAEPSAGIALAFAIALHNIPEGVCVAMPIYYSTGSKWKGFWWSFFSGVTEPLGGLVGYLILWNSVTPVTYAILYGLVAGMMVYISLRELLPMALKYDPQDTVTTLSVFLGMVVMAASLLAFTI